MHISWLEPMKTRRTTVIGNRRSLVYDDMDADAKLKIFDNGHGKHIDPDAWGAWQYRLQEGQMRVPRLDMIEPLGAEVQDFLELHPHRRPAGHRRLERRAGGRRARGGGAVAAPPAAPRSTSWCPELGR